MFVNQVGIFFAFSMSVVASVVFADGEIVEVEEKNLSVVEKIIAILDEKTDYPPGKRRPDIPGEAWSET